MAPKSSVVVSLSILVVREGDLRPALLARPWPLPGGLADVRRRVVENGDRPLLLLLLLRCVYDLDGEDDLPVDEYADRPPDRPTKPVIAPMMPPPPPPPLLVEYDHPETADLLGLLGRDGSRPLRVSVWVWLRVSAWLPLPLPNDHAEISLRAPLDRESVVDPRRLRGR